MKSISFLILNQEFNIHRFESGEDIPSAVCSSTPFFIGKTRDELSIVCDASLEIDSRDVNRNWSCFRIDGTLDFSLTGILSGISTALADKEISFFVVSTFDTDYILVKSSNLTGAMNALKSAGYSFRKD
jgi:hypothetical protein